MALRQLLYLSDATPMLRGREIDAIYEQSRHNNALDGLSGLLYTDGERFLQVIEGSSEAIEAVFARISRDPRHRHIVVILDHAVPDREFGSWSMARRSPQDPPDAFGSRLRRLLVAASAEVSRPFVDLIAREDG